MKEDLEACSQKALENIQERDAISENFKKIESSINFSTGAINAGSDVEKLVLRNLELEEKSLSIVPSMKINNQILMVN